MLGQAMSLTVIGMISVFIFLLILMVGMNALFLFCPPEKPVSEEDDGSSGSGASGPMVAAIASVLLRKK